MNDDVNSIVHAAIERYGVEKQLDQVIEECGELIVAVQHLKRGRIGWLSAELINEIADVEIMCKQLRAIVAADNLIDTAIAVKLLRLRDRILTTENEK